MILSLDVISGEYLFVISSHLFVSSCIPLHLCDKEILNCIRHIRLTLYSLKGYRRNDITIDRERRQTGAKPRLPTLDETNTVSTQQATTG